MAGFALALIAGAALVSHQWNGEAGLDPVYLILALGVFLIALPATRGWLAEVTNLKLPGGIELTRQVQDAVEAASSLPNATEEGSENDASKDPKTFDADWRGEPRAALGKLQAKLSKRLSWVSREIYERENKKEAAIIEDLRKDGLIRPDQARLLEAVREVDGGAVERDFRRGGEAKEAMVNFLLEADRVVYSLRLIVLDRCVRSTLVDEGLALMDIGGQPVGRWPDFYAFVPGSPDVKPLRVVVRMALNKKSDLIPNTRGRLRRKLPETPLDRQVQPVIVIPRISKVRPDRDPEIPAVRRDELSDWIAGQLESETLDPAA